MCYIVTEQKWKFSCLSPWKPNLWGRCRWRRKEVLFRCCTVWENGGLLSPSPSPQQEQDKSQCPELLFQFKVQPFGACRRLLGGLSPHLGSLTYSWLLFISSFLLEPVCGGHMAMAMWLLGCRVTYPQAKAPKCTSQCITWWAREREGLPPGGHWPRGPWREQGKAQCRSLARAASLFPRKFPFVPFDSLGMEQTRWFLHMTSQLPKPSCALGGTTSQLIPSFPKLHWQTTLVQNLPCTILTSVGLVPVFWSGKGEWGSLFLYPVIFLGPYPLIFLVFDVLSVRTFPLPSSWPMGETPQSSRQCLPVTVFFIPF